MQTQKIHHRMNRFFAVAGVVLLGHAATVAAQTLYVIRAPSASMGGMNAEFKLDGMEPFTLGPNGCIRVKPPAGTRQVMYRWRAGPIGNPNLETEFTSVGVSLAAGQTTHLRLSTKTDSVINARGGLDATTTWKIEPVLEADIKSYLPRCESRPLN